MEQVAVISKESFELAPAEFVVGRFQAPDFLSDDFRGNSCCVTQLSESPFLVLCNTWLNSTVL